jgi:hypothetical protein
MMTGPDTFDPTSLDTWDDVEVCGESLTVVIGEATYELNCENDAGHEPPHGGTLLWTEQEQTQAQEAQG